MAAPDAASPAILGGVTEATPRERAGTETPQRPADAGPRKDIQALRAIAVTLVVVYHFWPKRLTGGYVGVDVFFVISGFLITLHLLQRPIRRPADLFAFWARRVRRLIPAATLVLLATLGASLLWLPQTVHQRVTNEVIASALYVENWLLALTSTDYLAADQLHSPTQHYWSLSVEEQFYILWPVLIGLAFLVCRRLGRSFRFAPLGVILVVSGASLAFSAWYTGEDPAPAYFVSTTRIWELGVGAALAAAVHAGLSLRGSLVRSVLLWGGLAAIAWSAWAFTGGTPFPGVAALLPTVGTAAVIAARSDDLRPGPYPLWSRRPVQWLGDVSYSVYLWHWPAIVLIPFVLDEDSVPGWQKLLLLGLVLVLSGLTKRWVEDLMRFTPRIARSTKRSFVLLAVCLAASLGAAGVAHVAIVRADAPTAGPIDTGAACVGADSFRTASCAGRQMAMVTNPTRAAKDKPQVYADDCWNDRPFTSRKVCSYGPASAPVRIALYGNSHAGQWFPPLERLARERGWHIDTYLASECYAVDVPIAFNPPQLTGNCQAFNRWAQDRIRSGGYTLVVMSNRTMQPLVGVPATRKTAVAEAAYTRVVDSFVGAGSRVLAIRDTPNAGHNVPDCLARYADAPARCDAIQSAAIEPDPLARAVESGSLPRDRVQLLDATSLLCRQGKCPGIIGGLITFFDHGHMTESFASTLYPEVRRAVLSVLGPAS